MKQVVILNFRAESELVASDHVPFSTQLPDSYGFPAGGHALLPCTLLRRVGLARRRAGLKQIITADFLIC